MVSSKLICRCKYLGFDKTMQQSMLWRVCHKKLKDHRKSKNTTPFQATTSKKYHAMRCGMCYADIRIDSVVDAVAVESLAIHL